MSPTAVRVVLAGNGNLGRAALASLFLDHDGFDLVHESSDHDGCIQSAVELDAHLVVLNLDAHALDERTVARFRQGIGDASLMVVGDMFDSACLLRALEAGAEAIVDGTSSGSDLLEVAARVTRGEAWVPPHLLGSLLQGLIRSRRASDEAVERFASLSRREQEVLALLVESKNHEQIARCLVISPETARTHIQNVLRKLEVHSRAEAVALVLDHDLLNRFGNSEVKVS